MKSLILFSSRLITEMNKGTPLVKQSVARLLGLINWKVHVSLLPNAMSFLLEKVGSTVSIKFCTLFVRSPSNHFHFGQSNADVETRRSCFQAMPKILECVASRLKSSGYPVHWGFLFWLCTPLACCSRKDVLTSMLKRYRVMS